MIAKASVFIATSLDGFIARTDGSIDWLLGANGVVPAGEDCGYKKFMETVDTLIMGRNTFELALTFDEWPYGVTPVVVLSRKGTDVPNAISKTVSVSQGETPRQVVSRLSSQGAKHLYVDGGLTIQSFLAEGLLNEITITRIPVLLGAGRPLFGTLAKDVKLTHISTTAYEFGFVQSRYRIGKKT